MTRLETIHILQQHADILRGRFGVKSLALFGSVARDQGGDKSDVDLLVEFDRPVGLLGFVGTAQYLERVLGVEKVDLVRRSAVIPELRDNILGGAVSVFDTAQMEVPPSAHA